MKYTNKYIFNIGDELEFINNNGGNGFRLGDRITIINRTTIAPIGFGGGDFYYNYRTKDGSTFWMSGTSNNATNNLKIVNKNIYYEIY